MSFNLSHSGEGSVVEYQTLSSSNSTCYERTERLHEWLKAEDVDAFHNIFLAHPNQKLSFAQLRDELKNYDINFTEAEYRRLFLKINQNRDFKCDWYEFLSYLTLGFQDDDTTQHQSESLIPPISEPPLIKNSEHHSPIVSVTSFRNAAESQGSTLEEEVVEGKSSIHSGLLVTASKEGQIKFWSAEMKALRTCYSESTHLKMPTWILCIQALSDVGIICTSSTERELRFHETIASAFNLRIVIRSMPMAVCTMSYSSHPTKLNSRLILGDFGGNVRILEFQSFLRGPFQAKVGTIEVFWSDILKGRFPAFTPIEYLNIHSEKIQEVFFSFRLNTLFAAAEYRNTKKYRGRSPGVISVYEKENENGSYRIPMTNPPAQVARSPATVVTCGFDSVIIIWDPWTGRRKVMMKNCHTKSIYGEQVDIEITAACFDPLEQFLLTGARDGSIKIWSYNNAVCIRNMSIKSEHEVTAVIWVIDRILAVGWDRKVTEFNDVESLEYTEPKVWPTFHNDDITCADVKHGEGMVTATYSGELIFWKLETGQPYRKFNISEPTKFIELKLDRQSQELNAKKTIAHHIDVSRYVRESVAADIQNIEAKYRSTDRPFRSKSLENENKAEEITIQNARKSQSILQISVSAVLFLQTRPMTPKHGSVFVALNIGVIQVYSHHHHGGFIKEFNAVHKSGDCILTMCTDRKNRYLFTGSAFGYIKIWHVVNFCIPEEEKKHICMPLLRLQFIFLRKERFLPRAKRIVRHQKEPLLVSSYKGHSKAVNSITYINLPKILLSGSYDNSCRMWSLGGRYLGTLGSPIEPMRLSPFEPVEEGEKIYRMPPDVKKVASSTTIKVISGKQEDGYIHKPYNPDANDEEDTRSTYVKQLHEPILGQYFSLPGKSAKAQNILLDASLSYTPIYHHLKIYDADIFKCPGTPPVIDRVKKEEYMEFHSRTTTKRSSTRLRRFSNDRRPSNFTSTWRI